MRYDDTVYITEKYSVLQVHTPDLKINFRASHASLTVSGINVPQRKKETKRHGEREKL